MQPQACGGLATLASGTLQPTPNCNYVQTAPKASRPGIAAPQCICAQPTKKKNKRRMEDNGGQWSQQRGANPHYHVNRGGRPGSMRGDGRNRPTHVSYLAWTNGS